MKIPTVFNTGRGSNHQLEEEGKSGGGVINSKKSPNQVRRLERWNAAKNIEYELDDEPLKTELFNLSLPLPPLHSTNRSFRIDGEYEEEVHIICKNLGLSGPEDFAIHPAVWEATKERSTSDSFPSSRYLCADEFVSDSESCSASNSCRGVGEGGAEAGPSVGDIEGCTTYGNMEEKEQGRRGSSLESFSSGVAVRNVKPDLPPEGEYFSVSTAEQRAGGNAVGGGGIKGPRPPVLKPPRAAMSLRLFAGDDCDEDKRAVVRKSPCLVEHESVDFDNAVVTKAIDDEYGKTRMPATSAEDLTCSSSFTTSNEDDSQITAVDEAYDHRSNSGLRRNITGWTRGKELGRGSFGTVYEAMNHDGFFFAVKEVSLLDEGSNAQQCIQQLEQEIALLRNFKHQNIVQYLGTEKEEAKLFIFLELVTQGSLYSLYRKYHLRDSQVSVYTRQILSGLKYLHDQNVMHRDIKCSNLLVDATGSVKLADFGLAKETSKLSMLKSCKGSVYWMAPEVINPRKSYGPAADIWSLGCTVLEMLTRNVPYPDLEWTQALFKIGRGEKPHIPESLSKEACDFVKQCTQVDPDDRPTASVLLHHPFVKRNVSSSGSSSNNSSHGR